ncbi:MAG TPA: hypothetical protein VNT20_15045 [Flavisolibacter sp.]|jgi:hypothetical protein|nr:hypothetical protein [Flavisolibacter sp.]
MKQYFFIATLAFSLNLSAQDTLMFDTSKVDATTILIGRYPQYDKQKTYKAFNFIIQDPATIKAVIATLTLGKEGENTIEDPDFRIALAQNFKEVKSWTINPSLKSAMYNGHTYAFDISRLKELAKKYPFDYRFDKIPFKSKNEYESYLSEQKKNTKFLFDYKPQFKYEGSFDVQFPRNQEFSSPKAISNYLTPLIEKLVSKDDYRVSYVLNEKNRNDQTQFTMTITGSKKLYDSLQLDNLKKEEWKPTVEEGWFFYRTN